MDVTHLISIRFYDALNDFLPRTQKEKALRYVVRGHPAIKGVIESLGIPHTEVDLIVVDGQSVDFSYCVQVGDQVSVYPEFSVLKLPDTQHLLPTPLENAKFVLDAHLGRLAKYLRLLGFDAVYNKGYGSIAIIDISYLERRIILTRDTRLLKHKQVTYGYWLRSTDSKLQLKEVLQRFNLRDEIHAFKRCLVCNGLIFPVEKQDIMWQLPPKAQQHVDEFYRCEHCHRIYWVGSHYERMSRLVHQFIGAG